MFSANNQNLVKENFVNNIGEINYISRTYSRKNE